MNTAVSIGTALIRIKRRERTGASRWAGEVSLPLLTRCLIAGLMLALCTAPLTTQAQAAYRWIGKDGKVHYSDQPPPPAEASEVQQKNLRAGSVVETGGPSYGARQAARKLPLTLYTSDNCKENCRIARDFLKRRGAPFSEKVLRTAEDAAAFKQAVGTEELIVPVLQAGSTSEKGYEEQAWGSFLDAAGYPRDNGNPAPPGSGR